MMRCGCDKNVPEDQHNPIFFLGTKYDRQGDGDAYWNYHVCAGDGGGRVNLTVAHHATHDNRDRQMRSEMNIWLPADRARKLAHQLLEAAESIDKRELPKCRSTPSENQTEKS